MAILSIDTSAAVSASLVSPQGEELASDTVAQERRHAEELMPLIVRLLDTARLTPEDLTAVVAGRGPAPFTGLRVGLVTAHTFAFARDVPLYGVCSLDAIAADTAQTLGLTAGQRIAALSDARRKEVYWATYTVTPQGTITPLDAPSVAYPADLAASGQLNESVVVGAGAHLYREQLGIDTIADAPTRPSTTTLARLALARLNEDQPATPLYLRRPDAQVPAERKRATAS
ncbi:tRNA (adenosine(37)-N6)-threonylcarbamoyltransferase complex dimerization subunit type 1 TsaB [Jonesia denitrificans]|uniref:Peptidase M22 glycoprotease n=1 Tax=Jonesia denitrificans (strain ATCC 14870 / DSM 20603 / BCRC 15368 / CIP 55.134 / JCM 11481 / NBRC 15587 / NCTC 10816 / Prevot 55134) TaxID=471856 RepID=C7R178_JONDD|nr:tRNA (adenosine(37)-N6)-threonylcarbamoyltransferase complex dimerization subunit type 1 TsaB [Jonesia denitrificans]ACV08293.1 peptidase M22 glycoprotease [Jonesia denitrificans DSM 20603]ASE08040.1 tRNA (adenosine(37)-N6)-threonylcarbamoyltransferase complex dimerization subunit type 1 TsaB [Jonesia denitrificans]QXB42644.1 tRNA (adenosine(37)-N6)-threonylcarbamoyltransferase complex dimerization subunit type 1 TsaB [Jonesia denitrificans]SQH20274.1 UGMP family protein [Jonesia denitrifica